MPPHPADRAPLPEPLLAEVHRALFEEGADGILVVDPAGRVVAANPRAEELTGRANGELVGAPLDDLLAEEVPRPGGAWAAARREGRALAVHALGDGASERSLLMLARDLAAGNALAILRDVTERRQVERALRESEDILAQAVRVSDIGVFDHDHAADTLYWSPRHYEIHQLPDGWPITLQRFLERVHPDDLPQIAKAVEHAHDPDGDGLFDVEHRILRSDGAVRWLTTRSQTFFAGEGDERRPVRTVGAVQDITEDKQREREREALQEQLVQSTKLESIGRLAGGIAHDFNNMLTVILGHAELALADGGVSESVADELREIRAAAERSAELTRQLLGFARKQSVAPEVLDLDAVVQGSLKMLGRLIGEGVELESTTAPGLWPVYVDPSQVDQILTNLTVNACDAIDGEGRLAIHVENRVLTAADCRRRAGAAPGEYVALTVRDDGHGMDAATLEQVFEPFFTTKAVGTGLGLATVYGIAKQNEGWVDIASEPDRGTTVSVFLPRHGGALPAPTEAPVADQAHGSETILLVEDEPSVLQLNTTLLEQIGYRVLPAASASQALRLAEQHGDEIDLLLTDVVMPGMSGPQLAEQLTTMLEDLRCLFLSGYFDADQRSSLVEGEHVLPKPCKLDELAEKVREVLR